MCGRYPYFMSGHNEIGKRVHLDLIDPKTDTARYNIAPTQDCPIIFQEIDGKNHLTLMRWGLVPSWAKDESIGNKMINARSETVAEKPSFRSAFKKRRCLVPASGFYEWRKTKSGKIPTFIYPKNEGIIFFAGLWEEWQEKLRSFSILTCSANSFMTPIHDRMPVILDGKNLELWLDQKLQDPEKLKKLLLPAPENALKAHAVSTLVNSPRNDVPECVLPTE